MPCLQVGISAHTHQLQLSRNVVLVKFPQRHLLHAHPAQLSTATPICLATRTDCLPEAQLLQGCSRGEERLSMAHPNPEIFGLTPREESIAVF